MTQNYKENILKKNINAKSECFRCAMSKEEERERNNLTKILYCITSLSHTHVTLFFFIFPVIASVSNSFMDRFLFVYFLSA